MKMERATINFMLVVISTILLVTPVEGFFRHLCHGQLGVSRVDPMMSPGKASQHVHSIQGASNFGFDADLDQLRASNCTSCSIRQDKSAYWAPQLYFQHDNGTFQLVNTLGGLTVYYFLEPQQDESQSIPLVVFPKGFRMIAGNSSKRKVYSPFPETPSSVMTDLDMTQQAIMEKSLGFNCMNGPNGTEGTLYRHEVPDKAFWDNCSGGMRAEVQFPSCWNGIDVDSDNHTTHVAYPSIKRNGWCPKGYDKRLPTLLYETIYNTQALIGQPGQFVFAQGDTTGAGYHGDFINGWDDGVLEQALAQCATTEFQGLQEKCPPLDIKPDSEVVACKMETPEKLQNEQVDFVDALPGGCRIEPGVEWSKNCGKVDSETSAAGPISSQALQSTASTNTSTATSKAASATTSSEPLANSTSAAAPPTTTAAPTTTVSVQGEVVTYTSTTVKDGVIYYYVMVEELVTTTVVVEAAGPTPGASPVGGVKRHASVHSTREQKKSGHGHRHGGRRGGLA